MCRTGGASRLTASSTFPHLDDVDNNDNAGAHSVPHRNPVVYSNYGDSIVVGHHAIAAPSISPSRRSLTLDDADRWQGPRASRAGRATEGDPEVFCQRRASSARPRTSHTPVLCILQGDAQPRTD